VQFECGHEAFGGELEEILRFLIWINFVCAKCEPQRRNSRGERGELNSTVEQGAKKTDMSLVR